MGLNQTDCKFGEVQFLMIPEALYREIQKGVDSEIITLLSGPGDKVAFRLSDKAKMDDKLKLIKVVDHIEERYPDVAAELILQDKKNRFSPPIGVDISADWVNVSLLDDCENIIVQEKKIVDVNAGDLFVAHVHPMRFLIRPSFPTVKYIEIRSCKKLQEIAVRQPVDGKSLGPNNQIEIVFTNDPVFSI